MLTYTTFKIIGLVLLIIILIKVLSEKISGKQSEQELKKVKKKRTVRIGRHPNNDVVITDGMGSEGSIHRYHAIITQHEDGSLTFRDLQTMTGSFVNGERVQGEVSIKPGDVIRLGIEVIPWESYLQSDK